MKAPIGALAAPSGKGRKKASSLLPARRTWRSRMTVRQRPDPAKRAKSEENKRGKTEHGRAPAAKGGFGRPLRWSGPNPGALRRLCPGRAPALLKVLVSEKPAEPERPGARDNGTDNRTAHRRSQDPDLRRQARPAAGPRRSPVRRSPQSQQQCDRIRSASALLRRGGRDPHHHRRPPPHQERHRQQAQGDGDSRQTGRSARRHARRRRKRRARADVAHRSLASN